jgi:hypothetical protein
VVFHCTVLKWLVTNCSHRGNTDLAERIPILSEFLEIFKLKSHIEKAIIAYIQFFMLKPTFIKIRRNKKCQTESELDTL